MRPAQLVALTRSHGGVERVVTRRADLTGKWCNTLVCEDGFRYTLSDSQERRFLLSGLRWRDDDVDIVHEEDAA